MQEKPHILFVDDEANILQGLRRGLRAYSREWKISFAESGQAALDVFVAQDVDILVTDMRMPQMDGAQLLEKVRDISPDTARIVLSGYAKDESVLKVVGPAHQYLAKPCDFDVLCQSIERIVQLRQLINEKSVRALITGTKSLPSLPEKLHELIAEIDSPVSNSKSIAAILGEDLGLKSQILKVCNSAFFGMPRHVDNLETAVSLLGLNTLRSMVLLEGVFRTYDTGKISKAVLQKLCSNSLQMASIAQAIGQKAGFSAHTCDLISSAATLSHIGSLLIATSWPEKFIKAVVKVEEEGGSIDRFEREEVGMDHAAIGSYFLGLWGFPLDVCEAVAYHHNPEYMSDRQQPVLACLHIAQQMTKVFAKEKVDLALLENGLDRSFLAKQNIDVSLNEWSQIIIENLKVEVKS